MSEQKSAVETVEKLFHDFREANDARLADIEKSAATAADGLLTEKTEQLNAAITEAMDRAKAAEKAAVEASRRREQEAGAERVKAADLRAFRARAGGDASEDDFLAAKGQFVDWMRKGREGDWLSKAMSVDSDPDGGYLVMPDTSGRIATFMYESSPIRPLAAVQTISTDALEGLRDLDEAGSGWVAERGSRTATSTPQLGKYRIPVHELYAMPETTQKILDDAEIDPESWLAGKVAEKFARDENAAFVSGDGVGKPRGFTTYTAGTPSATTYDVVEQVGTGNSGAFAASDPGNVFFDAVYAMKSTYRQGAVWAMNRSTQAAVRKLKDGDGNYLLTPDFRAGSLGVSLLGFPVAEFEDMADIAADSLSIAFANFGLGYQIVDRTGVRVLRDPFSNKPYVQFYTTKRVGGDVVNFEAIKLIKFGSV
jgi:HK97 family phage major capsid protein